MFPGCDVITFFFCNNKIIGYIYCQVPLGQKSGHAKSVEKSTLLKVSVI